MDQTWSRKKLYIPYWPTSLHKTDVKLATFKLGYLRVVKGQKLATMKTFRLSVNNRLFSLGCLIVLGLSWQAYTFRKGQDKYRTTWLELSALELSWKNINVETLEILSVKTHNSRLTFNIQWQKHIISRYLSLLESNKWRLIWFSIAQSMTNNLSHETVKNSDY